MTQKEEEEEEKESREQHKRRGQKIITRGRRSRDHSKQKAAVITQKGVQPRSLKTRGQL
jgi:hypothetical protein